MDKFRPKIYKNACQDFEPCVELRPEFFQLLNVDGESLSRAQQKM